MGAYFIGLEYRADLSECEDKIGYVCCGEECGVGAGKIFIHKGKWYEAYGCAE